MKSASCLLQLVAALALAPAAHADSYNPSTGQLTIHSIDVGGTTFNDVIVGIGSVVSVASTAPAPANPFVGTWTAVTFDGRTWNQHLRLNSDGTYSHTSIATNFSGAQSDSGTFSVNGNTVTLQILAASCAGNIQCPAPGATVSSPFVMSGSGYGSQVTVTVPVTGVVQEVVYTKISS